VPPRLDRWQGNRPHSLNADLLIVQAQDVALAVAHVLLDALRSTQYRMEALLASYQEHKEAISLFENAVEAARQTGNAWAEMEALQGWAAHCEKTGDAERLRHVAERLCALRDRVE